MSVTTTNLGPNSARIDYSNGETLANLIAAINTWVIAHGWELWDAGAGVNAKGYRALNRDGISYKYLVLDYNTAGYLLVKVYETWDAVNHVGANLCYHSGTTAYAQRIDLTNGGYLCLFATSRYMVIQSSIAAGLGSSTGNAWCGCLEVSRDNLEDTSAAGYPCWIWANGWFLMGGTLYISGNYRTYAISFPRTRDESTGSNASEFSFVSTEMGFCGINLAAGYISLNNFIPSTTNAWNNKNGAWTLRVGKVYGSTWEKRGRLFGLHVITRGAGTSSPASDNVQIKINAAGFVDPNGALTDHWTLSEGGFNGRWAIPK